MRKAVSHIAPDVAIVGVSHQRRDIVGMPGPKRALRKFKAHLVKQIFAPRFVAATEVAHDLAIDMQAEGLRAFDEPHPRFIGRCTAFAIVASLTAGDQIVPVGMSAS